MQIVDDRTEEQKLTHRRAWGGTDQFMSGCGAARGGASYAFWAYREGHGNECESWVRSRSDILRVREITLASYRTHGRGHCHIYVRD